MAVATSTHEWQRARFTGTLTCAVCGLLPLDDDDMGTGCPGRDQEMNTYTLPNPFVLANMADCAGPDSEDSPGAKFLSQIADVTVDALENRVDEDLDALETVIDDMEYDGELREIADQCVPIYTHELWATFVDLAAYLEDPIGEFGAEGNYMERLAGIALYMIAERLTRAVAEDWVETMEGGE